MTGCTVHDVGMHLIRQRGPAGDPEFIAAYLVEEVNRRSARRRVMWADVSRETERAWSQLKAAFAALGDAFGLTARSVNRFSQQNRHDYMLAGD